MKLISTIYTGDQIEVTLTIQSKNTRTKDGKVDTNSTLITRYRSKIGNESLIFNPTIALVIRGRQTQAADAWVPLPLIYRFTASLSGVYQNLQTEKLYNTVEGTMYVDRNIALANSRRLSLFRNSITLTPGVTTNRTGKPTKAIDFIVDEVEIGTMAHTEVLGFIDLIDHMDIAGYAITAGIIDELESTNSKLDLILARTGRIENLLTAQKPAPKETRPAFNWQENMYGAL